MKIERKLSQIARYAIDNPSSIREIMNLVVDFRRHPERFPRPLIYFGGGWPQDPPPEALRRAMLEVTTEDKEFARGARYSPTRGDPDFLQALTEYESVVYRRSVDEEEIISGAGTTDLAAAIFLTLIDGGDEIVLTNPSYLNYERQIEIVGRLGSKVTRWQTIRNGQFDPNLDELQQVISPKTKMIVVVTPGNPDGQVLSDETLKGVTEIAGEKGVLVMVDVAYRAFHFVDIPGYFSRPRAENEIWLASLSKELRIPGWRMGYAITDPGLMRAIETVQQARTLCPARPQQRAFVRLMDKEEDRPALRRFLLEETPEKYGRIAGIVCDEMGSMDRVSFLEPRGGFYVFFNVEEITKSSKEFVDLLLKEWQVALAPGIDFGMDGWVRLSFAPSVEDLSYLRDGLGRIARFIESKGED